MLQSYIKSAEPLKDGLWRLVFDQMHDALTIRITAIISADSISKLQKALRSPTLTSGNENTFIAIITRNQLLVGHRLNGHIMGIIPEPTSIPYFFPIYDITPDGSKYVVWLKSSHMNVYPAPVDGASFDEILYLFGKDSHSELVDYLARTEAVAEVYSKDCIYLPIPIPVLKIDGEVL